MAFVTTIEKYSSALMRAQGREAEVLANGHLKDEALLFAIFRNHADASADRVQGRTQFDWLAIDPDISATRLINSEECSEQLAAPRADQAGDTDDFSGAHRETQLVAWMRSSSQIVHTQKSGSECVRPALVKLRKRTADHQRDHALMADFVLLKFADM